MTFLQFDKFLTDFNLCPDILSKPKAFKYFNTLASLNSNNNTSSGKNNVIDEHLFIEALALAALEVVYKEPQPEPFERLVLLVEKMSQSGGPAKVQMAYGVPILMGQKREVSSDLSYLIR